MTDQQASVEALPDDLRERVEPVLDVLAELRADVRRPVRDQLWALWSLPRPGDVVWIPPGQKHWHGASPGSPMTHIAVQEQRDGKTAEWFEKVTDEQYGLSAPTAPPVANKNSRAQQLFGEIAPKFAELTDEVLYADI